MTFLRLFTIVSLLALGACAGGSSEGNDWVDDPLREWPDIALCSEVDFGSKVYNDYFSGFLVDTGDDTLAITSKHAMVPFVALQITSVDFQNKLKSWVMYPGNHRSKRILLGDLLNKDPKEFTAMPGSTNITDWLIFDVAENNTDVKALKMANTPLSDGDILYAMGLTGKKRKKRLVVAGAIIRRFDNQIFFELTEELENPEWFVGGPIINKSGEVVGVFSSINEKIARSCSVTYLSDVLSEERKKK